HYRDISINDPDAYRQAYHDVLTFNGTLGADARQGRFYRAVPISYVWDDHDYGPNNSDRTHVGRAAAATVYLEIVPHYPLPAWLGRWVVFFSSLATLGGRGIRIGCRATIRPIPKRCSVSSRSAGWSAFCVTLLPRRGCG